MSVSLGEESLQNDLEEEQEEPQQAPHPAGQQDIYSTLLVSFDVKISHG